MKLTPHLLATSYRLLKATEPFNKWNLPSTEDIKFRVTRSRIWRGQHIWTGRQHEIEVSAGVNSTLHSLLETMAHEMIHVYEQHHGLCSRAEHSKAFHKLAARVCQYHRDFDPKRF